MVYSLGATSRASSRVGYAGGLAQSTHETLEAWTSVQLLVIIPRKSTSNVLMLVVVSNVIVPTRGVLLAVRILVVRIGMLDVRWSLFGDGGT